MLFRALPLFLLLLPAPASAQANDKFVEALVQFVTAVDGDTGNEGPTVVDALRAMDAGLAEWDRAVAAAEAGMSAQIDTAAPDQAARMRTALGLIYLERGRIVDALAQFDRVTAAAKAGPEIHMFRGWALRAAGRTAEAAAAFSRASSADPGNPMLAYLLLHHSRVSAKPIADVKRAMGAILAAEKAIGSGGSNRFLFPALLDDSGAPAPLLPWVRYADGYELIVRGRHAEAIERLRTASAADPLVTRGSSDEDERTRMRHVDALVASGQPDTAERALLDTVRVLPRSGQAHWRLGQLYRTLNRDAEAIPHFEAAANARLLAGAGALHRLVGQLQENNFEFTRAIDSFVRAIDTNLNDAAAHRELAEALQALDRFDEAHVEFVVTLLLDPKDATAWTGLAQLHASAGRLQAALDALRRATTIEPRNREARYALARILIQLGRTDEGTKELQAFEQLQREAMAEQRRRYQESVK